MWPFCKCPKRTLNVGVVDVTVTFKGKRKPVIHSIHGFWMVGIAGHDWVTHAKDRAETLISRRTKGGMFQLWDGSLVPVCDIKSVTISPERDYFKQES